MVKCFKAIQIVYLLAACGFLIERVCQAEQEPIRIGLMTELTGPAAPGSGFHCKRGYDLAIKTLVQDGTYEGIPLAFLYGDTQGEAKAAVNEFNRLVNVEKVNAVVCNRSQVGMALNSFSERAKTPLIGIVGHSDFLEENPYSFRAWPSAKQDAQALAQAAFEKGFRSIALVTLEDEWTLSLRDEFRTAYEKLGGAVLVDETVIDTDTNFVPLITKLRSKSIDSIFVNLNSIQTGAFLKKLHELGVTEPKLGNFYARNIEVREEAGIPAIEGLMIVEVPFENAVFKTLLQKNFKDDQVSQLTYTCYTGLKFLLEGIVENSASQNDMSIMSTLNNKTRVTVFEDTIPIQNREIQFPLTIKTFLSGSVVIQ